MKTAHAVTLALALTSCSAFPAFAQSTAAITTAEEHRTVEPGFPGTDATSPNGEVRDVCRVNDIEFYPYDCTAGTRGIGSTGRSDGNTGAAGE